MACVLVPGGIPVRLRERRRARLSRSGTRGTSSLCGCGAGSGRPVAMAAAFFHRDPRKPRSGAGAAVGSVLRAPRRTAGRRGPPGERGRGRHRGRPGRAQLLSTVWTPVSGRQGQTGCSGSAVTRGPRRSAADSERLSRHLPLSLCALILSRLRNASANQGKKLGIKWLDGDSRFPAAPREEGRAGGSVGCQAPRPHAPEPTPQRPCERHRPRRRLSGLL